MAQFSDDSCETIMAAANAIDTAMSRLDELPTKERLSETIDDAIEQLTNIAAKLDAIVNAAKKKSPAR
jgi:DNA-binding FrmR family transcriptional regulator